jgi:putative ABC transport system permease protein
VFRIALKDLFARKRRLVTTGVAVVLGIAFLTGTQLLSVTLSDSIKSLVGDVYSGFDAVVRSPRTQETPFGQPIRTLVPGTLVEQVGGVDGVRAAAGVVESPGPQLVGDDGKVLGGGFGPPTLVYNWIDDEALRIGVLRDGRAPQTDTEVVIDFRTAESLGKQLGESVDVATTQDGVRPYTVVGISGLGDSGEQSTGARPLVFTTAEAQRLVNQPDQFNYVVASSADGATQDQLAQRLSAALPDWQVLTGAAFTEESQEQISQFVGILEIFVSVFGYVALFVAIFIIYNTFSIIITQRTRETALLRAVGATRRQVIVATLLEAVVVGLIAAVLGLLAGLALAAVLLRLLSGFFTIASTTPGLSVGVVLLALAIGVGVTVLSAVIPAIRSSKVPPIAAIGEVSLDRSGISTSRKVWGGILVLGGVALIVSGLAQSGPNPLFQVGGGAVAILVSVAVILGPLLAAPVSRVLAAPFASGGRVAGRLAGENAARSPKRTAATAAALTIGVTLVTLIAVVASSIKSSADAAINESIRADFVVATASLTSFGAIPPDSARTIQEVPGVDLVSPVRFTLLRLLDPVGVESASGGPTTTVPAGQLGAPPDAPVGQDDFALGVDPATWFDVIDAGELEGSPADLTAGTMAVDRKFANDRGWRLGDRIPVYFVASGVQELTVSVLFEQPGGQASIWLPLATFEPNTLPIFNVDNQIFVTTEPGADTAQVQADLNALFADLPTVQVQDLQEYIESQTGPINTFLGIVYALLGLAIVIALIGIANTLSLSVLERTRELGLLRAVGMTRRQLKRTIRIEAGIIAVFGTLMGLVIGILFAVALTIAIAAENPGLLQFRLPIVQLVVIVVVATGAGIVAAVLPARRAARMDVLEAVSST